MKKFNYTTNLLNEISKRITNVQSVVWIGVHPWLSVIYQYIVENGVSHFAIMDNDVEKQGKEIWMYKYSNAPTRTPFTKINVESVKKKDDGTIYLMSNTHEKEIRYQLTSFGIDDDKIFNLYKFSCGEVECKKRYQEFANNHKALSLLEVQKIELDILIEFRNYCEKNNLRYYLGGGTLIGAVRHNGFIPWDDDVDVYMPYDDYRKFIFDYKNHGPYELLEWRRENDYPLPFAKLTNNTTCLFHSLEFMNSECIISAYIDIFPISGYPSDINKIEQKWNRNWELDAEWYYYQQVKDTLNNRYDDVREKIELERHELPFDKSEYVGNVIRTIHRPWAVNRGLYDETVKLIFEGELFDAPSGYKQYLEYRYGEYMKMPPENKREQHLFPTYCL